MCDLLWADPDSNSNGWSHSQRGVSYTFNEQVLDEFLKHNNIELVCRAHQLVNDGYQFSNNNKLVTLFSAPNYCGACGNDGAVMKINDKFECSFLVIKPINKKKLIYFLNVIHTKSNKFLIYFIFINYDECFYTYYE